MHSFRFFTVLFLSIFISCLATAQDSNKKSIQSAYDALNRRDWTTFASLCSPDYTDLNVSPAPVKGIQSAIELYKGFFAAFPDFKFNIEDIFSNGSGKYAVKLKVSGTQSGAFGMIPPTGKMVMFGDVDILEFNKEGKCTSHAITQTNELLRQIGYGSMTNPAVQTVIDLYGKFGQRDIAGVLASCTDDVVFDIHDRMFDTHERTFTGKPEVGGFFKELGAKFQYSKFQPTRFIADGDDVIIWVSAEYTLTATGKKYSSNYTHYFKVVNGKVTMFRGIDDFQKSLN
jgi:ketosteroid isomerase-like protein